MLAEFVTCNKTITIMGDTKWGIGQGHIDFTELLQVGGMIPCLPE